MRTIRILDGWDGVVVVPCKLFSHHSEHPKHSREALSLSDQEHLVENTGWLQLKRQQLIPPAPEKESTVCFMENSDATHNKTSLHSYPPLPLHTPDSQLPFVPPDTIDSSDKVD